MYQIEDYCEKLQDSLMEYFWNEGEGVFQNHYPLKREENWIYWWHAHVIDCLLDGYLRTKDKKYLLRAEAEYNGVYIQNGGTLLHNWYDDMEWMALALLRFFDVTGEENYKEQVLLLWEDIKTAWNTELGGMSWKKDQRDYRNTPANAPAAILAYRLYRRFSRKEDLEWGDKILAWNRKYLTDPITGFVWDGLNRLGDGEIDYDWRYTYNQGVMIGALLERYEIHREKADLELAVKIAEVTGQELTDARDKAAPGILPYEGEDDCGLFKGIYVRYLEQLIKTLEGWSEMELMLRQNARCLIEQGVNRKGLAGGHWDVKEEECIDLAQHLSGIMLLEMASRLG